MERKSIILFLFLAFSLNSPPFSYGEANYDLKEITPAVKEAIENRQARFHDLQPLKAEGVVGEDNQGFVKLLKDSSHVEGLVAAENENRRIIYEAVADQNPLGPAGLSQVQSVFAEVQRGKARPGEWIQLRSGEWVQK